MTLMVQEELDERLHKLANIEKYLERLRRCVEMGIVAPQRDDELAEIKDCERFISGEFSNTMKRSK